MKRRIKCPGYTSVHEKDFAAWGIDCALCGYHPGAHR